MTDNEQITSEDRQVIDDFLRPFEGGDVPLIVTDYNKTLVGGKNSGQLRGLLKDIFCVASFAEKHCGELFVHFNVHSGGDDFKRDSILRELGISVERVFLKPDDSAELAKISVPLLYFEDDHNIRSTFDVIRSFLSQGEGRFYDPNGHDFSAFLDAFSRVSTRDKVEAICRFLNVPEDKRPEVVASAISGLTCS